MHMRENEICITTALCFRIFLNSLVKFTRIPKKNFLLRKTNFPFLAGGAKSFRIVDRRKKNRRPKVQAHKYNKSDGILKFYILKYVSAGDAGGFELFSTFHLIFY